MKSYKSLFFLVFLFSTLNLSGQKIKKGWNFGPLPAIAYNSDLGFQYGALCDIFYFGDGSEFPDYIHKFNVEVSQYTKGSGIYHLFYDSKFLLPGLRTTVDVSYLTDKMMDFYGYNGYMSLYDETKGDSYYKMDRRLMRVTADIQGKIAEHWRWAAGIGFYGYKIGAVKLDKYVGKPSLYKEYLDAGLISAKEAEGGDHVEIKAGLVNDTRNNEADPVKGFCNEAILAGSSGYLKLSLVHRGYVPLSGEKLTFAYRVAYQGTILGETPFYMLQNLTSLYLRQITNEGLGGLNTIRGVLRNRIVGEGVAWTNMEVRYRFMDFKFLRQDWYLVLNPFLDAGRVVQYYKKNRMDYSPDKEQLHMSAGLGAKAIMNRNFVVSAEWGKPFDVRDGKNGTNIGLNFIF